MSSFKRGFPYQELPIKKDTERREHEMNNELMERIRLFNCKAEKAEKDGYTVADGFVWDGWGNPTGPCARKVCKVEDYR